MFGIFFSVNSELEEEGSLRICYFRAALNNFFNVSFVLLV